MTVQTRFARNERYEDRRRVHPRLRDDWRRSAEPTLDSGSVPNDAPLKDQSIGAIRKVDSTFGSDALAYMDGRGNSFPCGCL